MYKTVDSLGKAHVEKGSIGKFYLKVGEDGVGAPIRIPVFVARGIEDGPRLGLTSAIHGNEINGIKVISRLIKELESHVDKLKGTVIAIPFINGNGLINNRREYIDKVDLNRIMPGKKSGNRSEVFAYNFTKFLFANIDYLIDLHTASFGRVNSLYVRADLENPEVKKLALLQHPQIIVHNSGRDGSLRGAAAKKGIKAITVEVGNPQQFQKSLIKASLVGIHNIISYLKMFPIEEVHPIEAPVICKKSYWLYTTRGGILEVFPKLTERVKKDQVIATQMDIFGNTLIEYKSPEEGIVVGKSTNPISQTGARILHLGIP